MKTVLDHNAKHIFVFFAISLLFLSVYLGERYVDQKSCQQAFPNDPCKFRGTINRSDVQNDHWVNTSLFSLSGLDEYREKPQYGYRHAEFQKNFSVGTFHYDPYDATDVPFGTIAHLSEYISENTGVSDSFWVLVMMFVIFQIFWEIGRHLAKL